MNLKELRNKKGWTQYDLEFESGISQAVISRIERGAEPNEDQKKLLMNVLK